MGGTYFSNIALVYDSDFGVTNTMEASTPFYPVFVYFNHNTMAPAEIKYYKYQTAGQIVFTSIFAGSDASNFKIMATSYSANTNVFFMNLRNPQFVCFNNCNSCTNGTTCGTCLTTFIPDVANPGQCTCPDGTYRNNVTNRCEACNTNCTKCDYNDLNLCTNCADPNSQISVTNTCECKSGFAGLPPTACTCTPGKFIDGGDGFCKPCSP